MSMDFEPSRKQLMDEAFNLVNDWDRDEQYVLVFNNEQQNNIDYIKSQDKWRPIIKEEK